MIVTILQYINKDKTNLRPEKIYKSISYIKKPHKVIIFRSYPNEDYQMDYDKYYKDNDNVYIYHNKFGKGYGQHIYLMDLLMKKVGIKSYLHTEDDEEYLGEHINDLLDRLDREDNSHPINHLVLDGDIKCKKDSTNLYSKSGKISIHGFKNSMFIKNGIKLPSSDLMEWIKDLRKTCIKDCDKRYWFIHNSQKKFTKVLPDWFYTTDGSIMYFLVKKYGGFKYIKSSKYIIHHDSGPTSMNTSDKYTFEESQQMVFNVIFDTDYDLLEKEFEETISIDKINRLKEFIKEA